MSGQEVAGCQEMGLEQVQSREAAQDVWETDTLLSVVRCGRLVLICQEECGEKRDLDNCAKV